MPYVALMTIREVAHKGLPKLTYKSRLFPLGGVPILPGAVSLDHPSGLGCYSEISTKILTC